MKASISVVTYNRLELTKTCIKSILDNTPRDEFELIVVDNDSTDGTCDWIYDNDNIDRIMLNPKNYHLGYAINQAYQFANPKAEWLITFANDEYAMPGWWENLWIVEEDLKPDYLYAMMRIATFKEKKEAWTINGGHYLLPPKEPEIGATFCIKQKTQRDKNIWFNPEPWRSGYGSPFSILKHQLDSLGMKGVELAKPCVLIQDCRFNDPEMEDYYKETFGIRGKLDRFERLKNTANYVDKDTLKEYYKGSGYVQYNH